MRTPPGSSSIPSDGQRACRTVALALLGLLSARPAEAAPSRVAVVENDDTDDLLAEAMTRVRAELVAAGFDVAIVDGTAGADPRARVESAGLDPSPVATLALLRTGGSAAADIWVSDRLTGKTLVRHVDVKDVPKERAPMVLAVRTVELLRASLLEATADERVETPSPARAAARGQWPPAVPPDVARWMAPPAASAATNRPFLRAEIGAGMLVGFSGGGPAIGPLIRVGYGIESLSVRLGIVAPTLGAEVTAPSGSATVRQDLVELELVSAWPRRGPWALTGSLGGGASHVHVEGSASAPYVAHRGSTWTFAADAGLGGMLRLGERLGLLADLHAVLLAPRVAIDIADAREQGRRPMELATLGLWGSF